MWFFLGGLGLAAALAGDARAHQIYSPTLVNRHIKVSVTGRGRVRIAYTLMFGEGPSADVRAGSDGNRDGLVDEREKLAWAATVQRLVESGLALELDGGPASPRWDAPIVGMDDQRVGPIPFSIDLVAVVRVDTGREHVLRIDDETPIGADDETARATFGASLGETDVVIEEGPETRVLAAWRGIEDAGRAMQFVFRGPKYSILENRSVGLRFVDESRGRRSGGWPIALGGALAAAVIAAWIVRRSRRS